RPPRRAPRPLERARDPGRAARHLGLQGSCGAATTVLASTRDEWGETAMRRQVLVGELLAVALRAAAGCSGGGADAPSATPTLTAEARGGTLEETVATPSLANNILGDPAERDLVVHLPPSYDVSDARYPVVYFLAGAG